MKISFINQIRLDDNEKIKYEFEKDFLKITYKGKSETLNFENLPNGKLVLYDEEKNERLIKHTVGLDYLISARKENDVLFLKLLNHIPENAAMEERFPKEIDYTEYRPTLFGKEREELIKIKQKKDEEKNLKNQ